MVPVNGTKDEASEYNHLRRSTLRLMLITAAALCVPGLAAHADTYSFSAVGSFTSSGTLTTTSNGDDSYTVVGITGSGITGLIQPGRFEYNDNQLFPSQSALLDIDGLSFTDVMGNTTYDVNISYDANVGEYFAILRDSNGNSQFVPETFQVSLAPNFSTAPEPSSIALLSTGLLGIAGVVRNRLA